MHLRANLYVCRTLLLTMLAVGGCALILILVFALAEEAQSVSETRTLVDVFLIVLFALPRKLYEILPFVIFLGSLIGLGTLSTNSELTVLRGAGISVFRIAGVACAASLAFYLLFSLIAAELAPRGEGMSARLSRSTANVANDVRPGSWLRHGNVLTSIGVFSRDGTIQDVRQYEFSDQGKLHSSRQAESGVYSEEADGWILSKVETTSFDGAGVHASSEATLLWVTDYDPVSLPSRVLVDADKLALLDLARYIGSLRQEGVDSTNYRVAFWSKVSEPFAILGLVFIAAGIVVGPLREVGMGLRLTAGIAIGFTFKYVNDLLTPLVVVYGLPAFLAALVPVVIVWSVGVLLVRRSS